MVAHAQPSAFWEMGILAWWALAEAVKPRLKGFTVWCRCVSNDSARLADTSDSDCEMYTGEGRMLLELGETSSDDDLPTGPSMTPPVHQHLVAYVTPKTDSGDTAKIVVTSGDSVLPFLVFINNKKTKGTVWHDIAVEFALHCSFLQLIRQHAASQSSLVS